MQDFVILTSPLNVMVPIIKVVGDYCNLRCDYCFYNVTDQSTPRIMSMDLLDKFISQYMDLFTGDLIFIWHGGEPLLAGLDFFKTIVSLQNKYLKEGQRLQNTIQTNATLVNDLWAGFFRANNFRVGVSVDGAPQSHDHFRINKASNGSFAQVMAGIKKLREHDIEPGIIQTLTKENVKNGEDDFRFFTDTLGSSGWGTNVYLDVQGVNRAMLNQSISNDELTVFMKRYIDLWLSENRPDLRIREIENFISGVFKKKAPNCTFNGSCTGFFCIEDNGRVYPCDRLSNRPELLLGNLSEQNLSEILNGQVRLNYAKEVNSIHPDCSVCEWQKACHNGCTMHRVGGINGKYYYCETRKEVFSYLKKRVESYIPEPI